MTARHLFPANVTPGNLDGSVCPLVDTPVKEDTAPLHRNQSCFTTISVAKALPHGMNMNCRSLMVKPPYRRWEFDSPRQWHKRAYNGEGLLHECLGHHETPHDSLTDADRCIVHIAASLQFCQLNVKHHSHSITQSHMLWLGGTGLRLG